MQAKTDKQRTKREYAAKGQRSQKMMTFRLDNENAEWLSKQINKGRYINDLISKDKRRNGG